MYLPVNCYATHPRGPPVSGWTIDVPVRSDHWLCDIDDSNTLWIHAAIRSVRLTDSVVFSNTSWMGVSRVSLTACLSRSTTGVAQVLPPVDTALADHNE